MVDERDSWTDEAAHLLEVRIGAQLRIPGPLGLDRDVVSAWLKQWADDCVDVGEVTDKILAKVPPESIVVLIALMKRPPWGK